MSAFFAYPAEKIAASIFHSSWVGEL